MPHRPGSTASSGDYDASDEVRVGRRRPRSSSRMGVGRLGLAIWRSGGQDEGAEASAELAPCGESHCCRSRSFRLPASRRHCTCSRTCYRSAGRAGASSARASPACSGGRRGSTPPTRQSSLPFRHSKAGRGRKCAVCVAGQFAEWVAARHPRLRPARSNVHNAYDPVVSGPRTPASFDFRRPMQNPPE